MSQGYGSASIHERSETAMAHQSSRWYRERSELSRRRVDTDASVNAQLDFETDQDHKPDAAVVPTVIRQRRIDDLNSERPLHIEAFGKGCQGSFR
jgi:hypothetical protein